MKVISPAELLPEYDYIFAGAGCAALSLLHRMIGEELVAGRRILLVDTQQKNRNDRTWCFWEKGAGPFEDIVKHRWSQLDLFGPGISRTLDIGPYEYKVIHGIDFYRHCQEAAAPFPGIHFLQAPVQKTECFPERVELLVEGMRVSAPYLFNSIYTIPQLKKGEHWLLQHFKGFVIETPAPAFDPVRATLMDFRVPQREGTSFVYVLPFSKTRALVEYTLFTEKLLQPAEYDAALRAYIGAKLGIQQFEVLEEEFGVIPMTNVLFPRRSGRILNIGTAGGRTKGSSGYTFRNIQKDAARIVASIKKNGHPFDNPGEKARFHFYDSVLLDILAHRSLEGADIFSRLFQRNDPRKVLRFLDNESGIAEELRIISTLPTLPFARAALRQLTGL